MKFTAKAAAAPPQAMDSMRVGLRGVVRDMICCLLLFDCISWNKTTRALESFLLPAVRLLGGWMAHKQARDSSPNNCHVRAFRRFAVGYSAERS